MQKLYHVSEHGSIKRFDPRPSPSVVPGVTEPVVWTIDEKHLINYLLPRECPRVTYYAIEKSNKEDIDTLLNSNASCHVVAIEDLWFEKALESEIWIYEFQPNAFSVVDEGAGYFASKKSVTPTGKRKIKNPLVELISRGAELRIVSSLWPLRDAVIQSSLQFSCVRMPNAKPRETKT